MNWFEAFKIYAVFFFCVVLCIINSRRCRYGVRVDRWSFDAVGWATGRASGV